MQQEPIIYLGKFNSKMVPLELRLKWAKEQNKRGKRLKETQEKMTDLSRTLCLECSKSILCSEYNEHRCKNIKNTNVINDVAADFTSSPTFIVDTTTFSPATDSSNSFTDIGNGGDFGGAGSTGDW